MKLLVGGGQTDVELNLLLLAHSLEKGMSLPSPKPGFGYDKAVSLLDALEAYRADSMDENRYAFVEGVSVLGVYIANTDNDMSFLIDRYKNLSADVSLNHAGFDVVSDMDFLYEKVNTKQGEFFIRSRHSIRSYENICVDKTIIRKVLELASCAPSACNRQPVKVYVSSKPDKVEAVSGLILGNKGFEDEVPNWAIVSIDKKLFNYGEPLQWYINGGIYLSYIVEAFHAYHIGSCIFQTPMNNSNTMKLRDLISIPKNEAIIAAIGFGYAKKQNKIVVAQRRPVDEILVEF